MNVPAQRANRAAPRIAFVGEAPGADEVDRGQPFVGASGRVFNAMLRTANLDRADFHITNVFDEKIPNNDLASSGWIAPRADAERDKYNDLPPIAGGFLRPDYRHHLNRLSTELAAASPTVIVPLGATALWALTGAVDIGNQRGSIQLATRIAPGKKLIPTYHPALVMRQWKFFSVVTADIIRAYNEGAYPDIRLPVLEALLEPTFEEVVAYTPKIMASDLLSVDIETGWGMITNIGFAPDDSHAINIPFIDLRKPNRSYWTRDQEAKIWRDIIHPWLASPVPKLGQNFAGYDFYWLLDKHNLEVRNLVDDTRLAHHALYPELPKSLQFLGASYTDLGSWKDWGHKGDKRDDT